MADTSPYSSSETYREFSKGPKSRYYGLSDEALPNCVLNIPQTDDDDEWGRTQRISDESLVDYVSKIYKTLFDPYDSITGIVCRPGEAESIINVAKNMVYLVGQPGGTGAAAGVFDFDASTLTLGTIVIDGTGSTISISDGCELSESILKLDNDFIFTGGVSSSTIVYEDLSLIFNSTASTITLSISSSNIVFDADGHIGLSTDADLLQLGIGTLTVAGSIYISSGSTIGITTDHDLITLASDIVTITPDLRVTSDIYFSGAIRTEDDAVYITDNLFRLQMSNDNFKIYLEEYDPGDIRVVLQIADDQQEYFLFRLHHWSAGDRDLFEVAYTYIRAYQTFKADEGIEIGNGYYIGTGSDTDLLKLESNLLTINGDLYLLAGSFIGITTDTDLLRLYSGYLTLNGNLYLNDNSVIRSEDNTYGGIVLEESSGTYFVSILDCIKVNANIALQYSYINETGASSRGLRFYGDLATLRTSDTGTSGDNRYVLSLTDESSVAAGVGAGICFRGRYSGDSTTEFAGINAYKANSSSGDREGHLCLQTRLNSGNLSTTLKLTPEGIFLNPGVFSGAYIGLTTDVDLMYLTYDLVTVNGSIKLVNGSTIGLAGVTNLIQLYSAPSAQVNINGILAVGTDLGVNNDISVGNDLGVANDISVSHNIGVSNNISVGNDVGIGNDLGVTNDVSIGGDLTISGDILPSVTSSSDIGDTTHIMGNIYTTLLYTAGLQAQLGTMILTNTNIWPNGSCTLGVSGSRFTEMWSNNYYPFTGSHPTLLSKGEESEIEEGMVAVSTGEVYIEDFSNTIVEVSLSKKSNDKRVYGVFKKPTDNPAEEELKEDSSLIVKLAKKKTYWCVNALGEGQILVVSIDGREPKNGDLLTTSVVPGYATTQNDDLFRSYTIAKVTQDINWNTVTDYVTFEGKRYKKALVAVTYHCG